MVVYRRTSSAWLKWVLFIVVFVLGMTMTFTDVYGIGVNNGRDRIDSQKDNPRHAAESDKAAPSPLDNPPVHEDPPVAVPEPATFLLVGAGLGAAYLVRRHYGNK